MANSCDTVQSLRTGDGVTTQFSFTFTYDKESEVNVSLWDTTIKYYVPLANDQWSFVNATTVEFTTAPPALIDSAGNSIANVKIWRQTNVESLLASFYPGSAIRAQDLNSNFDQLRNAIQEGRCVIPQPIIDNLVQNYWNKNNETIKSADTWISDNNHVATTASIDNFVVDTINDRDYVIDAPNDGTQYGRQSGSWTTIPYSIPDAPADNRIYGRRDNSWAEVINVDSVNGKTGVVVLDADDVGAATSTQGATADSATQPGDNISTLTNDSGYITIAQVPADVVSSVNTQTGAVVLDADDIDDTATIHKFATTSQLSNADSATQPGDNVSTLTNDAGYLISVPVESVNGETGAVSIGIDDLNDVNVAAAASGNVLSFDGNGWIPVSAPPADISGSSINQLMDVNAASATDGQVMVWDDTTNNWIPGNLGSDSWVLNGSVLQPVDDTYDVEIGGKLSIGGPNSPNQLSVNSTNGNTVVADFSGTQSFGWIQLNAAGTTGSNVRVGANNDDLYLKAANTVAALTSSGSFAIGGTLPSAPNITLNGSDGSATFAGKVGIGTTSPVSPLSISDGGAGGIEFHPNSGGMARLLAYNRNTSSYIGMKYNANDHRFRINDSEKARIDSSGRLLVGTSSTTGDFGVVIVKGGTARVLIGRESLPAASGNLGALSWGRTNGEVGASIKGQADANWTSGSSYPTRLVFSTTADGASSPTERMRIDSSGNVKIGGTLPSAPAISLDADGSASFAGGKTEILSSGSVRVTRSDGGAGLVVKETVGGNTNGTLSCTGLLRLNSDLQIGNSIAQDPSRTPKISLNADGTANFAEVVYPAAGVRVVGLTPGNSAFRVTSPDDKTVYQSTGDGSIYLGTDLTLGSSSAGLRNSSTAYINAVDGSASFAGKLVSASTVSGDTGTTLVTKDYVDSTAYPGIPQNAQTSAYTLVSTDNGKHISITTGGVTVPSGVFSVGDTISIYNNSAADQTITQGSSVTLRFAGTVNVGNRTLAQRGLATVLCVGNNEFVISGGGLS